MEKDYTALIMAFGFALIVLCMLVSIAMLAEQGGL